MLGGSEVYDLPRLETLQCRVRGRLALSGVVVEVHQYRFKGPQAGTFRSARGFLDLALSPRPGRARGDCATTSGQRDQPLGDILFIPANRPLTTEWGDGEQLSVCCGFDTLIDKEDEDPATIDPCPDVRSVVVRDALARLAREIEEPGFCSELLGEAIWTQLRIELVRYLRRVRAQDEMPDRRLTRAQLRAIEERIAAPGRLPPVEDLARACGLSTRHFFRMFRATAGVTLSAYAASRRIDHAKLLLATSRPAIKEIAWQCGFETAAAFSAAFRRAVGVTPKEYRHAALN